MTVTHVAGDTIDGSNLYVVGTTGSGRVDRQWEGDYGVSDVSAGSRVTVENVAADYELRVVRESADRGTSATLSASEGPGV